MFQGFVPPQVEVFTIFDICARFVTHIRCGLHHGNIQAGRLQPLERVPPYHSPNMPCLVEHVVLLLRLVLLRTLVGTALAGRLQPALKSQECTSN